MSVNWNVHPDLLAQWPALEAAIRDQGLEPQVRSARRTCAEQAEQYSIGRSGPNDTRKIVTQARGCQSWHVTGRALDIDLYRNGKKVWQSSEYAIMGAVAKALGWKWGGDFPGFPDPGHVEWYYPGITIEQNCPDPGVCTEYDFTQPAQPTPETPTEESYSEKEGMSTGKKVAIGVSVAAVLWAGWQWYKMKR